MNFDSNDDKSKASTKYEYKPSMQWWSDQEEIVISGISGRLPESDNVQEFADNLFNGVDMITEDDRRWEPGTLNLPRRHGKMKSFDKFDAEFFGFSNNKTVNSDPQLRLLLETSYEAIIDACIDPAELVGSNVGTFVAFTVSESSIACTLNATELKDGTPLAHASFSSQLANVFGFTGPNFSADSACSSSQVALQLAIDALRLGNCGTALVVCSQLTLSAKLASIANDLGVLSPEGISRTFDANENGYVRSEGSGAILLQKSSLARRIHGVIANSKSNNDGYKVEGITFPSARMQQQLLTDVYNEGQVNPADLSYFEAHATGTKAGDPEECKAAAAVFCSDRKTPLLIGSVKSNAGHGEASSGLLSIFKVLIAMKNHLIPGNLYFEKPNPNIPALLDGRLKVVAENTPYHTGPIGISSLGFGGSNNHLILRPPKSVQENVEHWKNIKFPILLLYSGRTEEATHNMLELYSQNFKNLHLYHALSDQNHFDQTFYPWQGYLTVNNDGSIRKSVTKIRCADINKKVQHGNDDSKPVCIVFGGFYTYWHVLGTELMAIDIFRNSVRKCADAIQLHGLDLLAAFKESYIDHRSKNSQILSFVVYCATQVGIIDILSSVGMPMDYIIGYSTGEIAASYAAGSSTLEECMMIAYEVGLCIFSEKLSKNSLAVIAMKTEELENLLPCELHISACITPELHSICGPSEKILQFIEYVKQKCYFGKLVSSEIMPFNFSLMQTSMMKKINGLINNDFKKIPSKWTSAVFNCSQMNDGSTNFNLVHYLIRSLCLPIQFYNILKLIPDNSLLMEVSFGDMMHDAISHARPLKVDSFDLFGPPNKFGNCMSSFFECLGKMYEMGITFSVKNLYSKPLGPLPTSTPFLSTHIIWDHTKKWPSTNTDLLKSNTLTHCTTIDPFTKDSSEKFILDYKIDGHVLYPFSGYLVLVWKAYANMMSLKWKETHIVFRDVSISRATLITKPVKLHICISFHSGYFEVTEQGVLVASGFASFKHDKMEKSLFAKIKQQPIPLDDIDLNTDDIYKELHLRGHEYGPNFKIINKANNSGFLSELIWDDNWVTFIDGLMQTNEMLFKGYELKVPVRMNYLCINPQQQKDSVYERDGRYFVKAYNHLSTCGITLAGGVLMRGCNFHSIPRRKQPENPIIDLIYFTPYMDENYFATAKDHIRFSQSPLLTKYLNQMNEVQEYCKLCDASAKLILNKYDFKCSHYIPSKDSAISDLGYIENDKIILKTFYDILSNPTITSLDDIKQKKPTLLIELQEDLLWNFSWIPQIVKSALDILLENTFGTKVKIAQIEPISPLVVKTLHEMQSLHLSIEGNYELIGPNVMDFDSTSLNGISTSSIDVDSAKVIPEKCKNKDLIVLDRVLCFKPDPIEYLHQVKKFLRDDGFVIICETTSHFDIAFLAVLLCGKNAPRKTKDQKLCHYGLFYEHEQWLKIFIAADFMLIKSTKDDSVMTSLYLLRKIPSIKPEPIFLSVDDNEKFSWVEPLKKIMAELNDLPSKRLWLVAKKETGIQGLVATLRLENAKNQIRCIYDASHYNKSTKHYFDINNPLVQNIIKFDLTSNVYKDGHWGKYSCQRIKNDNEHLYCESEHAYVNLLEHGDLNSLDWIQLPEYYLNVPDKQASRKLVSVYYAAVNFQDVMIATGRLAPDALLEYTETSECLIGLEFAGRLQDGKRVMGLVKNKGIATTLIANDDDLCEIPEHWSMEQAATIPLPYYTAYCALVEYGKLKAGEKVLIHSSSSGIDHAALTLAFSYNCEVFATADNPEKRRCLLDQFKQLQDDHIFNSCSTDFEYDIQKATNCTGVDLVLNSLPDEKRQASIRCLAENGRFVEIGQNNFKSSHTDSSVFGKNLRFCYIFAGKLFKDTNDSRHLTFKRIFNLLKDIIQPAPSVIFEKEKVEDAFRFMSQEKNNGKVLIKIRNEETESIAIPRSVTLKALQRAYCNPFHVYIVAGGLSGMALEMVQWLISRGAKKFVLTSRSGVKNGYQSRYLRKWEKEGAKIILTKLDASKIDHAQEIINLAQSLGPIGGIFNLAMVLTDGLFEDQTPEHFTTALAPKYLVTKNLDLVSREKCDANLKWFVVFSSFSATLGNSGQTSYTWANSAMEQIIRKRFSTGLPALAIEWGTVGDVGIVIQNGGTNDSVVGGASAQRIQSCLKSLDFFLCANYPVVTSYIKKKSCLQPNVNDANSDFEAHLKQIVGVSSTSQLNPSAKLTDFGLDSLMAVEIKQVLEREHEIVLSLAEIRTLSIGKLRALTKSTTSRDKK